jgi:predicted transcriptional regulator
MARRLIREEGLLCGGSSGSAMVAALQIAKTMKKGQRLVVLLADSVRNYMSKFLNDQWMIDNNFAVDDSKVPSTWWSDRTVAELKLQTPLTVAPTVSCQEAIDIMRDQGYDQIPVVGKDNEVLGMVTMGNLTSQITSGRVEATDSVSKVLYKQFRQIPLDTKLGVLSKIFDKDHFVLVVTTQRCYSGPQTVTQKTVIYGVVTRVDLLNYIVSNRREKGSPSVGAVGAPKAGDEEAKTAVEKVLSQIGEKVTSLKGAAFEVISSSRQVVNGINFFVKVLFKTGGTGRVAHLRIHRSLQNEHTLHSLQDNKAHDDPLVFF